MTESGLHKTCKRAAEEAGCLWFKLRCEGQAGFPDILLVGTRGRLAFIELKNPKGTGRLSEIQRWTLKKLSDRGVSVHICSDYEHVLEVISSVVEK